MSNEIKQALLDLIDGKDINQMVKHGDPVLNFATMTKMFASDLKILPAEPIALIYLKRAFQLGQLKAHSDYQRYTGEVITTKGE